jgi:micrococcal nuclease
MRYRLQVVALFVLVWWLSGCDIARPTPTAIESATEYRVRYVLDGDTIELTDGRKIRYLGINTPERDQPYYEQATLFNANLVADQPLRLEYDVVPVDQYGRTLAHVFVGDTHINLELIRQGYANAYTVPPNLKYADEILAAEREAREDQRGLWAQSATPVRITALDPYDEWVELTNQDDLPVDLSGYTLKDEANHIYTFEGFTLGSKEFVRLFSRNGINTDYRLYWGLSNDTVWNNDGDTAYLRDPDGALVDLYTY